MPCYALFRSSCVRRWLKNRNTWSAALRGLPSGRASLEAFVEEYHRDVAFPYLGAYLKQGFGVEILGGGRIAHDSETRSLRLYGFSYGFPWRAGAGHEISAEVCRRAFPDYEAVRTSLFDLRQRAGDLVG